MPNKILEKERTDRGICIKISVFLGFNKKKIKKMCIILDKCSKKNYTHGKIGNIV